MEDNQRAMANAVEDFKKLDIYKLFNWVILNPKVDGWRKIIDLTMIDKKVKEIIYIQGKKVITKVTRCINLGLKDLIKAK